MVAAVFASAARDQLIARSPAQRIMLSPPPVEPVVPLTVEQVASLRRAMPERMQATVLAQAGLGLRVGELLALRVSEVDFLRREVHIIEQIHPRTRERMQLKTPSSRRILPLPQMVADALAAHLAEFGANDEGYVFTNALGQSYQAHTYQFRLRIQAQWAGLPPVTSHDLRHSYASWLLLAGESVVTVAARLGHKDASKVISTYGHLVPGTEDRTRRAIDSAWSAPDVPSPVENSS
jgi:integrase